MTNLEAFKIKYQDESVGTLVLNSAGIDPALSDQNELSYALGVWQYLMTPDYKQGQTSETLSSAARYQLKKEAIRISDKYDFDGYTKDDLPIITSQNW